MNKDKYQSHDLLSDESRSGRSPLKSHLTMIPENGTIAISFSAEIMAGVFTLQISRWGQNSGP
jgi:hypothetical protein